MLTVICALFQHVCVCIMRGISKPTSNSSWVITAVAALFAERVWHLCRICLFWLEAILKLLLVYALTNILFAAVCSLELQCIYISAWLANRKAISSPGCDHTEGSGVDFHRGASSAPPSHIKASLSGNQGQWAPATFSAPHLRTEPLGWGAIDLWRTSLKPEETFQVLHPSVFLLRSLPPFVSLYSTSSFPFGSFLSGLAITFMWRTHIHSSGWILVSVYRWLTWSHWVLCCSLNGWWDSVWDWDTWTHYLCTVRTERVRPHWHFFLRIWNIKKGYYSP